MNKIVKFRKSRLRFSPEEDSLLLTEVIKQNPFENPAIWRIVREKFVAKSGKPFTVRAIKDHVDLLTRRHVHGGKQGESGGYHTEHHNLLNSVVDLIQQCGKNKAVKEPRPTPYQPQNPLFMKQINSMNSTEDNRGELIYLKVECPDNQESMDGLDIHDGQQAYSPAASDGSAEYTEHEFLEQNNISSPEMTTLEYLKLKHKEEMQMKKRELKMEEKKLALKEKEFNLESQKFELQKWERSKRLEIEMKERELHMKILEQQQQLISMLFEKSNLT